MLVDDNNNNLKALCFIFEMLREDFSVNILKADDGIDAVKLFKENNQIES